MGKENTPKTTKNISWIFWKFQLYHQRYSSDGVFFNEVTYRHLSVILICAVSVWNVWARGYVVCISYLWYTTTLRLVSSFVQFSYGQCFKHLSRHNGHKLAQTSLIADRKQMVRLDSQWKIVYQTSATRDFFSRRKKIKQAFITMCVCVCVCVCVCIWNNLC